MSGNKLTFLNSPQSICNVGWVKLAAPIALCRFFLIEFFNRPVFSRFWSGLLCALLLAVAVPASADVVRGVYGVPSVKGMAVAERELLVASLKGINAVFAPDEEETISFFKSRGYKVYLSVNAFGGRDGWTKYTDARPVRADGRFLGEGGDDGGHGGICPTHKGWQEERLLHIRSSIVRSAKSNGPDGIWLDFIRYPGFWETANPQIPDTCYCSRCLEKFRKDRNIKLPTGLSAQDASSWIRKNHPYEWMAWKREQILSFVRKVKKIINEETASAAPGNKRLVLGAFVVPWTKGEHNGAVSFLLAQDAVQLSEIVDVISPMVYHKMTKQPESWVGRMTAYYKETARSQVWPIVQSLDVTAAALHQTVRHAQDSGADGILAFSYEKMDQAAKTKAMASFQPLVNLIPNPEFAVVQGDRQPRDWRTGLEGEFRARYETRSSQSLLPAGKSASLPGAPFSCIGIKRGHLDDGEWSAPLPPCEPGQEYVFTGNFYQDRANTPSYPVVSIWGQKAVLDSHWMGDVFQPLRAYVRCPQVASDPFFRLINELPGKQVWMGKPALVKLAALPGDAAPAGDSLNNVRAASTGGQKGFFYPNSFPIGVYGADIGKLEEIKRLAVNTVIIGGHGEALKKTLRECRRLGLRPVLSVPHEPERLKIYLDKLQGVDGTSDMAFYVNDEPELRSVPTGEADDIQRLIKDRYPYAATCMAVVRPPRTRDYLGASDFFMMDQYPFPVLPMTWLSDSMDEAAAITGKDRLLSVIQAFHEGEVWPNLPGWQQIDCLAFLSVVHGSRGIFFFSYSDIGKTDEGRSRLARVVGRLNAIYPWLVEKNLDNAVQVEMKSEYRVDPKGRPAVHGALKKKGTETMLIAVNTIGATLKAALGTDLLRDGIVTEVFSGEVYPVVNGKIEVEFRSYQTLVFVQK